RTDHARRDLAAVRDEDLPETRGRHRGGGLWWKAPRRSISADAAGRREPAGDRGRVVRVERRECGHAVGPPADHLADVARAAAADVRPADAERVPPAAARRAVAGRAVAGEELGARAAGPGADVREPGL